MTFFPPLPDDLDWSLNLIRTHLKENPDYLLDPDCPYPEALRTVLEDLMGENEPPAGAGGVAGGWDDGEMVPEGEAKWDWLERESASLLRELTEAKNGLDVRDNAEKMAYFRVATALLEKIVAIQERVLNLKHIGRFHQTVLGVMEDVLEPDQRTTVMERLRESLRIDV